MLFESWLLDSECLLSLYRLGKSGEVLEVFIHDSQLDFFLDAFSLSK